MSGNILKCTNDSYLYVCGGTDYGNGSSIFLYGKDSEQAGVFSLIAHNGTSSYGLDGYSNGNLTWNNKNLDVIEEQGDGYIRYSNGLQICTGSVYVGNTGDISRGFTFTFERSFAVAPVVTMGRTGNNSGDFRGGVEVVIQTSCSGFAYTTADTYIHIIAIGKWK